MLKLANNHELRNIYKFIHKEVNNRDIPGAKLYTICGVMNNYVSLHKLNYVCIVFNTWQIVERISFVHK